MIIVEGLEWRHIYWTKGVLSRKHSRHINEVIDPPNSGWGLAFVLPGKKRSTIFSPYSFQAWTVQNDCAELALSTEPPEEFRPAFIREMVERKWHAFQSWGMQLDYDTCALVMRRLGWEVPAQVLMGGEEDTRKKGGKTVSSELIKPVKRDGKRGRFLQFFLDNDGSRSVREVMAELSMTRSNALSYLYMLQKDHGIGYELVGDMATVSLPEGCTDPYTPGSVVDKVVEVLKDAGATDEDLDTDRLDEARDFCEEPVGDDDWLK